MLRILVVDDDRDTAATLALVMELRGYEARTAYSGEDALRVAEHFAPDVAFIDLSMPRMDGYELARRLRQSGQEGLTIICLSGYGTEQDRRRSQEAGCNHHLIKPADLIELRRLLRAIEPTGRLVGQSNSGAF